MRVMEKAYEDSRFMLVGEQLIGPNDLPNDMFERYKKSSGGKMPAILGIDLGCYGVHLMQVGIGTERWYTIIDQITAFAEQGGIVTASVHWQNPTYKPEYGPLCRGIFGDGTVKYWDELLTEGSEINKLFMEELITDGKFLKELDDRGVTVLWRPLHEGNGNWFWFTARSQGSDNWIPAEYMVRLWKYIYNLYVNEMGLKNLIWVYGPNTSPNKDNKNPWGVRDVLYYYPGDEYVDMIGLDWYTSTGKGDIFGAGHPYDIMMNVGKPCAITEFGPGGKLACRADYEAQEKTFNSVDILNLMKSLTVRGMKCAYMLTWHLNYGALSSMTRAEEALADPFFYTLDRLNTLY